MPPVPAGSEEGLLSDFAHTKLAWNQLGRNYRITDVYGHVVQEFLA